jgi:pyrroloquinoline quinone (PQQ) biosynthesis protein C
MHDAQRISQRLRAAGSARDYGSHPFVLSLERRAYSHAALRRYAITLHRSTEEFVTLLYRLAAICPVPEARAQLIGNLLEEEGFEVGADGVTCRPVRRHVDLCRRFAHALGVEDHELRAADGRVAGRWFDAALEERRWVALLANLTVGQESGAPTLFGAIARALRTHYGVGAPALAFFLVHVDADRTHAERGVELCAKLAATPELEAEALEGARRGSDHLWASYRRLDAQMRHMSA